MLRFRQRHPVPAQRWGRGRAACGGQAGSGGTGWGEQPGDQDQVSPSVGVPVPPLARPLRWGRWWPPWSMSVPPPSCCPPSSILHPSILYPSSSHPPSLHPPSSIPHLPILHPPSSILHASLCICPSPLLSKPEKLQHPSGQPLKTPQGRLGQRRLVPDVGPSSCGQHFTRLYNSEKLWFLVRDARMGKKT